MITIFVLMTAENWNSILYQFILKDGWGSAIYFVSLIVFGNIMLLNLFLAVLLNFISDNLDTDDPNSETVDDDGNDEIIEEELDYIQERLRQKSKARMSENAMEGGPNNSNKEDMQAGIN